MEKLVITVCIVFGVILAGLIFECAKRCIERRESARQLRERIDERAREYREKPKESGSNFSSHHQRRF